MMTPRERASFDHEIKRRWLLTPAERRLENAKFTAFEIRSLVEATYPKPEDRNCQCCNWPTDTLILDHDHELEEYGFTLVESFRGWICWRCNSGIGWLGDFIDDARNAVKYLENADEQNWRCGVPEWYGQIDSVAPNSGGA